MADKTRSMMQHVKAYSLLCFSSSAAVADMDVDQDMSPNYPSSIQRNQLEVETKNSSEQHTAMISGNKQMRKQREMHIMEMQQSGGLGARYFQLGMHPGSLL